MSTENTQGVEALGSDGPSPEGSPVTQPDGDLPPSTVQAEPPARDPGRPTSDVTDPDSPVLVGVAFEQPLKAQEFLLAMSRLRADGSLRLKDAVIVAKTEGGDIKVTETIDPTPGRSALSGAMWTGLLGLIVGGPVGWLAGIGIGAGAGAVTAKVVDLGIPDEWVDWFQEAVKPGTATIAVLASEIVEDALVAEVHRFKGAELVYANFDDAMMGRLKDALDITDHLRS